MKNQLLWKAGKIDGKSQKISILINSVYYFFDCVFIVQSVSDYRLIIYHNGGFFFDKTFRTLRGARIAFTKLFQERCWEKNKKSEWSFFYEPGECWLKERKCA